MPSSPAPGRPGEYRAREKYANPLTFRVVNESPHNPRGVATERSSPLMRQGVRQNIHIHLLAVADLISAAATAAGGVCGVVQSVDGIDHTQSRADADAVERAGLSVRAGKIGDVVDGMKDRVIHRQWGQRVRGEDLRH